MLWAAASSRSLGLSVTLAHQSASPVASPSPLAPPPTPGGDIGVIVQPAAPSWLSRLELLAN